MRVGRTYTTYGALPGAFRLLITAIFGVAFLGIMWQSRMESHLLEHARRELGPVPSSENTELDVSTVGKLIRVNSSSHHPNNNHVFPRESIVDPVFNLTFPSAVKVVRHTEYCQWEQWTLPVKSHDSTSITFFYSLGWRDRLVPSWVFDQPFAHHNPGRDPAPSATFVATGATFGNYQVSRDLLEKTPTGRVVTFPYGSIPDSIAVKEHGFRWTLQSFRSGYIYSYHEPRGIETLVTSVGMIAEDSLLDFQIGDLLKPCNPGDIRVSFYVTKYREATIIAEHHKLGHLRTYQSTRNYSIGFIDESPTISADEILKKPLPGLRATFVATAIGAVITITLFFRYISGVLWTAFLASGSLVWLLSSLVDVTFRDRTVSGLGTTTPILASTIIWAWACFAFKRN
jgi:Transmembrane protein 43